MLKLFKSKNLQSVKHGFFGRSGGVSTGIYSSLNLSEKTADSAVNICANRALVMDELEISNQKVFFPNQQHTNKSVFIDKETDFDKIGMCQQMQSLPISMVLGLEYLLLIAALFWPMNVKVDSF